jgi:hypothetical protein
MASEELATIKRNFPDQTGWQSSNREKDKIRNRKYLIHVKLTR